MSPIVASLVRSSTRMLMGCEVMGESSFHGERARVAGGAGSPREQGESGGEHEEPRDREGAEPLVEHRDAEDARRERLAEGEGRRRRRRETAEAPGEEHVRDRD